MEKTNRIISYFEQLLDEKGLRNSEIENYIIRYLLIFCCAEISELTKEKISNRIRTVNDQFIINFIEKNINYPLNNPKMENLCKVLDQFDSNLKNRLKDTVDARIRTNWDTIITNRNHVAHETQCTISITINELKSYLSDLSIMFEQIEAILT